MVETDQVPEERDCLKFDPFMVRLAPYLEKLANCEVWLTVEGKAYRPKDGWKLNG